MSDDKRLSVSAFARRINVSRKGLYDWMERNYLTPHRDAHGRPYFLASEVEDFKANHHLAKRRYMQSTASIQRLARKISSTKE